MNFNQLKIALYTLVHKEIRRFMRIWPQTLLPPAITMSLYFVIFGNLVGSHWANGRLYLYAVHCARPDHDGGNHQQLRQRIFQLFQRKISKEH